MIESLKGQLSDWQYGRSIIRCFIERLSNEELDNPLPRKDLDTIRKHCEELIQIQSCYVKALESKVISFDYKPLTDVSKKSLLELMDGLDHKNEKIIGDFNGNETINWFGEMWNIHQHLSAMIGHEQMHIGQIIAFCYAMGIKIPDEITNKMSLNG